MLWGRVPEKDLATINGVHVCLPACPSTGRATPWRRPPDPGGVSGGGGRRPLIERDAVMPLISRGPTMKSLARGVVPVLGGLMRKDPQPGGEGWNHLREV